MVNQRGREANTLCVTVASRELFVAAAFK